jgi:uncharacterized membrane protein YeaQ/YmgE (transglycosylase-associated protein family)
MGILANIVVGIAGSVLGFWLAGLLRIATGGGFGVEHFQIGFVEGKVALITGASRLQGVTTVG